MVVRVAVGVNSCRLECELVMSGFQRGQRGPLDASPAFTCLNTGNWASVSL